jgi:hypothetical protein
MVVSQFAPSQREMAGGVAIQPAGASQGSSTKLSLVVLSDLGDPTVIKDGFMQWDHSGGLHFALQDVERPQLQEPQTARLVTQLVRAGSFRTRPSKEWLVVGDCVLQIAALESAGYAKCSRRNGELRCCLTDAALRPETLTSGWLISSPQPALEIRPNLPLQDRTSYELL